MYHALNDEAIPYTIALNLAKAWCTNGASVELITNSLPEFDHTMEEEYGAPAALQFFEDRNGLPRQTFFRSVAGATTL
ncbi:hypothetical protein RQP46_011181 [Phenoliferia psychrophenolica]